MTKTVSVPALTPGQVVSVAGCRKVARVVARVGGPQKLYRVLYNGAEIEVRRGLLGVLVKGEFRTGPFVTDNSDSKYPIEF